MFGKGIAASIVFTGSMILIGTVGGADSISSMEIIKGFLYSMALILSGCWLYALAECIEAIKRRNERRMRKYD